MVGLWAYSSRGMITTFYNWVIGQDDPVARQVIGVKIEEKLIQPEMIVTPQPVKVEIDVKYPDPTIYPTYTPYPTPTRLYRADDPNIKQTPMPDYDYDYYGSKTTINEAIKAQIQDIDSYDTVQGIFSYYWPPLGGINCDIDCNYLAGGQPVKDYVMGGWACPVEFPLGQIIYIEEMELFGVCMDRGGAIVKDNGRYWFDHLNKYPELKWRENITVRVYK